MAIDEGQTEVEGWRLDEGTTQTVGNKFLHHGNNLEDTYMSCVYLVCPLRPENLN